MVALGKRVGPLFFFQSVPNSVAGLVAAQWGLRGPVVCLSPRDRTAGFDEAALLIADGDADQVLIVLVNKRATAIPQAMIGEWGRGTVKAGWRAQLAADPAIGAGNVLATVIAQGADLDGPGLTFDTAVDQFPAEHPLTLGELDERVQARTAWLHERGIGRRDVVAIWATEAADIVLSFLALTRVGAIPALMNGKMAPAIADEYIRRLRVTGVLADANHKELLRSRPILGSRGSWARAIRRRRRTHYRHHRDDPVVITHTTGTTGVPKAVLHTHTTLYAALKHLLTMPQAQGTDRILNALPIPHTATILMVNQVLGNRAEMLLLSSQDAPTWCCGRSSGGSRMGSTGSR